jgi:GNAT superfamily N-acetyltransferase
MTDDDLQLGMRLKVQAGWNQCQSDWRRLLRLQPDGCFVAEWQGVPIGTAVACAFDRVAWLAMVLVDAGVRGRGIGAALVEHALSFLDRAGVQRVRLDATPLGQPLYAKFGFAPEYELARYAGLLPATIADFPAKTPSRPTAANPAAVSSTEYENLCQLDHAVLATDRRKFLLALCSERPDELRVAKHSGEITGYLTARPGSQALQIGPCIAARHAGEELFVDAARRYAGRRVILDIPCDNAPAMQFAKSLQLEVERTFVRMCRGPAVADDTSRLWASSGPELG